MPYFDRFDICEAYFLIEMYYNVSGILQERKSNQRRKMSNSYQLWRMKAKMRPFVNYESLSDNGKAIYDNLLDRYNFKES